MRSEKANAPPSLLLWSARAGRYSHSIRLRPFGASARRVRPLLGKRTEGARDAKGPNGPACLGTSRHRGSLRRRAALRRVKRAPLSQGPRKSASPKASRARCFRFAPRRFPVVERLRALRRLSTVEDQALGPASSDKTPAVPAVRALDPHAERAGSFAAWTAGPLRRISSETSFPGHRSPPRV